MKRPPGPSTVENWSREKADANIGYLPHLSGHVVIDVDDPDVLDVILLELGIVDPPVVIRTPRGGYHVPLLSNPIPTVDLRPRYAAEIRCNGLVVGPGSVDPKTGRAYRFERGSYGDFLRLPQLDLSRYEALAGKAPSPVSASRLDVGLRGPIHEGRRNHSVFTHVRSLASTNSFPSFEDVVAEAQRYNAVECVPPLPDTEVIGIARSVWQMAQEGRCLARPAPRENAIPDWIRQRLLRAGRDHDRCLALVDFILRQPRKPNQAFALAAAGMARANLIPTWGEGRYRRTTRRLVDLGILHCAAPAETETWISADGKRHVRGRAPALYRFAPPSTP